ncbi:alpha/beta hydrolase [Nocardioidaceae bacterium]|nr:alpha/beta hydrolase [Nocardioidaceae bacterium]
MPSLTVRDARLARDVQGRSGPAVVQLHGLTSSRLRETQLGLDLAREVVQDASRARVLSYDARGHGRSTGALDGTDRPADFAWEHLASDLLEVLDLTFGDQPVHGVGPSMGAATLLHAAVREPERFTGLTLTVPPTVWESRAAQAASYEESARLVETEGVEAFLAAGELAPRPPAVADHPLTPPDVAAELLPTVLRGAALSDLPAPEAVAGLRVPTLLLAWTEDPTHPLDSARRLQSLIAGSELVVAESPAHVATWPARFRAQLETAVEGGLRQSGRPAATR